jgi:hypothetical protein
MGTNKSTEVQVSGVTNIHQIKVIVVSSLITSFLLSSLVGKERKSRKTEGRNVPIDSLDLSIMKHD